jgi:hypothetical protein
VGTVFWDAKGCILVNSLKKKKEREESINMACYIQMLINIQCTLCEKFQLNKAVILQYRNA